MANPVSRNIEFWRGVFEIYVVNNPLYNTPGNKEILWKEFLAVAELDKTFLENLFNICLTTHDATNAVAFFSLQKRLNIPTRTIGIIFKHIAGLGGQARFFINHVGSNVLGIEKFSKALGAASGFVICMFTAVQMYVHWNRGEYGLAIGELFKTILSVACAPAAVIDMIDQLIGSFAPDLFKNPFVRLLRMANGLQGAKHLIDTVMTLGMVFGYAHENRNAELEKALGDLATRWEQSPFNLATEASREAVVVLNNALPNYKSRWGFLDGWIQSARDFVRNLAEYTKKTRPAY
jgi:hypothetical protein